MKKIKLCVCIIEDDSTQLTPLKEHLCTEEPICLYNQDELTFICVPLNTGNEQTGVCYNRSQQIERAKQALLNNWDAANLFLVDCALLGEKDVHEPVSLEAISEVLNAGQDKKEALINRKKFIVLITGKSSRNGFDINVNGCKVPILCVEKPVDEDVSIYADACPFKPNRLAVPELYCKTYDDNVAACPRSKCLSRVIERLALELGGIKDVV